MYSNQVLAVHAVPVIVQNDDEEENHEPEVIPNPNAVIISSRPSSQLSQNGSSGYGSTRSQVGPFGTSNRPSPSASSSSSSDSNQTKPKKKRSVWFGGSLRGRAASTEPTAEQIVEATEIKTRGQPQYASLRIPNRIQATFEDRGLDLVEAEVDSDVEEEPNNRGQNEPHGYYPLRNAGSLEAQVHKTLFLFISIFSYKNTNT